MISIEFKQNVESGDLVTVRSALVDDLIIDRTFEKFDEALAYARPKLDVIQPYDNSPFETEAESWDNRYLNRQKVALMVNFSKERIEHIKNVIRKIQPVNSEDIESKAINEKRTGRTVLSEKPVKQKTSTSSSIPHNNDRSTAGRTGKRVISETPTESRYSEEKNETEDAIGTVMIVEGVAVAAFGLVTAEPIVIATGIVITGVGVGLKVKSRG